MGLTSFVDNCQEKTWFDENPNNRIVLHNRLEETTLYLDKLPTLHKMLFAFMPPNLTIDSTTQRHTVQLNNFGLVIENDIPATFKIMNPSYVYKKTRDVNCVSTPLIMSGLRYIKQEDRKVTYIKDNSANANN